MLVSTTPRIEKIPTKYFVGKKQSMSLVHNTTGALWKSFMPHRHHIIHSIGTSLYAIQEYPLPYFCHFDPANAFIKWAVKEVSHFEDVPENMDTFTLPAGWYAIFNYQGAASEGAQAFQYIFSEWLPRSNYRLDNRPHFEVLGEKYRGESAHSEEEIWIPVLPQHHELQT